MIFRFIATIKDDNGTTLAEDKQEIKIAVRDMGAKTPIQLLERASAHIQANADRAVGCASGAASLACWEADLEVQRQQQILIAEDERRLADEFAATQPESESEGEFLDLVEPAAGSAETGSGSQ